jgi:DNA-binding MurR/RpiR family transcriptional regulator
MNRQASTSFQNLQDAILACQDSLTPTEHVISNHLLEHPWNVALMSVHELASQLQTGPASIIRLAKKLGYKGYAELKGSLKQEMRDPGSPLERFKHVLEHGKGQHASGLDAIVRQEMKNLQTTIKLLDAGRMTSAAALLGRATLVFTAGAGISYHLAGLAAFVFQHIGLRTFPLQLAGLTMSEQLLTIRENEVLLAFAFPPYSAQTIEAAALARSHGAAVLGITDQTLGPLAKHCNVVLVAKTESNVPSNSLTAPLLLIHGLATAVASSRRRQSLKAIDQAISLRERKP